MARNDLISLDDLNALAPADFLAVIGPVFENAPWVAETVQRARPFASLTLLHKAMIALLKAMSEDRLVAFLRGHPRLSPNTLRQGTTRESTEEQTSAGIGALDAETHHRLDALNDLYEARFGFPFILAIRHASLATLLATIGRRLTATAEAERAEALAEITAISWMRLLDRVRPAPTGGLSTHVLDTVRSAPAAGLNVELWRAGAGHDMARLDSVTTNENGRCGVDLADGLSFGTYEWRYDAPSYFAGHGYPTPARAFLGKIKVAFSVWNPEEHYHVPLLLTPGSYTSYRGS